MVESVYFLGSRFDTGSLEEAVANILAETRRGFKYVVTPNVHHMVRLLQDPATVQPRYERAWRVFCDSRVLSRLAWLSGRMLPGQQQELLSGVDPGERVVTNALVLQNTVEQ